MPVWLTTKPFPSTSSSGVKGRLFFLYTINLLSNAIKYSTYSEAPRVEINSYKKDGTIVYSFRDNGVGFDMTYADKLFSIFQRLHPEGQFKGTGVGLAIVQRIVNKHGGKVWAEGKPGEGAIFYFSLPE
ncbi:ATP-binding protein [Nitrosomonas sp. Nm33]|uniref:sensor histidine kinase n=1 Tax=Nitrosomonas sp. Nm33 TaxID=133724 RepID=UPI000B81067D|nr:ATP-binding protein [Nitrosomonas sp. Nm33]